MKPLIYSLLPRPPHPTRDGGAIRMHFLLRALVGEFRVRAFVRNAGGPEVAGEYPSGVEVQEVSPGSHFRNAPAAAAMSLLAGGSYAERLYRSRPLSRALAEAVERERPSWVVAHSYQMGAVAVGRGAAAWIDFQNVDSEIWARIGQTASSAPRRWFASGQAPRVAAFERRLLEEADGVSCVSARDARALNALSPGRKALVVPNGTDLSRYAYRAETPAGERLFFVGDLSWPPNAEGIRWFQRRVWPILRRRRPDARVEILGRGAPADLLRSADAEFRFLGEGRDTRPLWKEAALAIVPLQAGGGTRLKILEAAACGVPVLSTPVGSEGLELEPGTEIAIAREPEDFAEAAARLLADPEARRRQAAAARRRVEGSYDWERIGADFAHELLRRARAA